MDSHSVEIPDGRRVRGQLQRARRRAALLNAAQEVFAARGYHQGSISDIIERAGVARGTFYLHFESKREIFETILETLLEELHALIRPVEVGTDDPPMNQLHANLRRVFDLFVSRPALTVILFRQAEGLDTEFDSRLEAFYAHVRAMLQRSLTIGMELGLVRPVNPELTAILILGSIKEAMIAMLLRNQLSTRNVDQAAWDIVHYNLQGLRAS